VTEEWRSVLDGWYEVSDIGRVRRVSSGRVMKLSPTSAGYPAFTACIEAVRSTTHVHCLVAEAFIGPRSPGYVVNHIDGVKTHNVPENLEYVTPRQNAEHSGRTGLAASGARHGRNTKPERTAKGERHHRAVLTEADVIEMRRLHAEGETYAELQRKYGLKRGSARDACVRAWRHVP
jgi:hypothetical protein